MNMEQDHRSDKQSGFTLIELMIALGVSALIAVMAYQAVSQVVSVRSQTQQHAQTVEKWQKAVWWLEQDLVQMAPRSVQDELGGILPALSYQPDGGLELTRLADFPVPLGSTGLLRVRYELDGEELVRWVWPVLDRAPDTQPQKQVLLTGVELFEVRLLDANNQFQTLWPNEEGIFTSLPVLTEVSLKLDKVGDILRLFPGVERDKWQLNRATVEEQNPSNNPPDEELIGGPELDENGEPVS